MSLPPKFACDSEFVKLMTRGPDVDLTTAALELARDACPDLDFSTVYLWIDRVSSELVRSINLAGSDLDAVILFRDCLAKVHGLDGSREIYETPDGSFLNRIIETRRGIPIGLSVLYIAVAQKVGINLQGVSAPGHFLTRHETVDGPVFIDAFSSGTILTFEEAVSRVRKMTMLGVEQVEETLEPVGPRTIILRMLNNLKALYAKTGNWQAAWVVQHRISCLCPSSYQEKRDLALISLRAKQTGQAIDLLESCLPTCPRDDRELIEKQLAAARSELVRWN